MTKAERIKVYNKYGGHCAYCGNAIDIKDMQVDHIVAKRAHPLYTRNITIDGINNFNPACRRCNHYKRANTIEVFRNMLNTLHKRVRDIYINKVAEDYGIIKVEAWDGKFYFERMENDGLLSREQLEDAAKCPGRGMCEKCKMYDVRKLYRYVYGCVSEVAGTALHYRDMLKRLMFVVEGFDYRTNIKFSISDLIGIEKEVKILLKSGG
jgi:hypothetical protein